MASLLRKFIKLTPTEKSMLIEALLLSFYIRLLIIFVPFKKLEKRFGNKTENPPIEKDAKKTERLVLIKKSILRLKRRIPWRYKCYEQSLTALYMLKKRKLSYNLYFGVKKEKQKLLAHVWIESNYYPIVPRGEKDFTVLSIYCG